ncbi:hypothetical protein AD998_08690 [bacterium 336/3]|nr:hypothetical protein AD998_08690 [bacterium 336/3]
MFAFCAFEGVKAQVQTLTKPLSKKTIQSFPETFVVLDTATYNQLFQKIKYKTDLLNEMIENQKEIIAEQENIIKSLNEESQQSAKIHKLHSELIENQKKQIELMQQEIESLKKQLAEKSKKK